MQKEHKLLEDRTVNHLVDKLNEAGADGWSICMYVQEFGVTKIVLEREVKNV